jgi:hypothetical protein
VAHCWQSTTSDSAPNGQLIEAPPPNQPLRPEIVRGLVDLCSPDRGFLFGFASRGQVVVAEWQGQSWNLALDATSVMPNGQVANSIAALGINKHGDVLFQFANGVDAKVVRRDGKLYQVPNFFRPTADGDWLICINAMGFRDGGAVYFLAVNALGEVVLYKARPLL